MVPCEKGAQEGEIYIEKKTNFKWYNFCEKLYEDGQLSVPDFFDRKIFFKYKLPSAKRLFLPTTLKLACAKKWKVQNSI